MEPIKRFSGRVLPLPNENVDTDQIIPARFLKGTGKKGLGNALFYDWRYDEQGQPRPDFILNQSRAQGTTILLAGANFGCGSSREHAPWALLGFGFKAVIGPSFADIFRNNSLKNGLLIVEIDEGSHRKLLGMAAENLQTLIAVDLERQILELPDGSEVMFPMDGFAKQCLLQGVEELGYLLEQASSIQEYESRFPPRIQTLGARVRITGRNRCEP